MSDPRQPDPDLPMDPTTVQPAVPPAVSPTLPGDQPTLPSASTPPYGTATPPPGQLPPSDMGVDAYQLPPERQGPGAAAGVGIAAVLLLAIGALVFFLTRGDDNDETVITDSAAAITLTIQRIEPDSTPIIASMLAEVAGPVDTPDAFIWLTPANAVAPAAASNLADGSGEIVFQWAPLERIDQSSAWRSTIVLQEELAPNQTLAALSYGCSLDRPASGGDSDIASNITVAAEIEALPVSEARGVSYRFPGHEFLPGDRVRCEIVAGAPNIEPTTTLAADPTLPPETTIEPTTTAVPETTLAPTTLPPTTVPATAAPATEAPATTQAPETTAAPTTTEAPATTALTIIDARSDLSTFRNLIDRADLREQLSRQDVRLTMLAPDNDAIAAFLEADGAPDLNDPDTARTFVLSYVFVGDILESSDIAARTELQLEEGPLRQIDATVSPITIGGAPVIAADELTDLAVVHTLGSTFVETP